MKLVVRYTESFRESVYVVAATFLIKLAFAMKLSDAAARCNTFVNCSA